jgi:hypothetical protein
MPFCGAKCLLLTQSGHCPLYGTYLVKKFKEGGASFFFHQFRCFEKSVSSSHRASLTWFRA